MRAKTIAWLVGIVAAVLAVWPLIVRLESQRSGKAPVRIKYDVSESGEILWLTFPADATDADLVPFRGAPVRNMNLSGTRVTDAGLESLGKLPRLQMLDLSNTPGLRHGLELAARWTTLEEISAAHNDWVDDRQVEALAELQDLNNLNLQGTQVTDSGMEVIGQLPKLQALGLSDCAGITDATLARVESLPQLKKVTIERTAVTWEAWSATAQRRQQLLQTADALQFAEFRLLREAGATFSRMPSATFAIDGDVPAEGFDSLRLLPLIQSLQIHSSSLTDEALIPFLENQPELTCLDIVGTQITARAVSVASDACPRLASVDLSGTQITGDDFPVITAMTGLHQLRLSHLDLAGADLSGMAQMTLLSSLRFDESTLDDAALQTMAPLPNLKILSLDDTRVTPSGIKSVLMQPSLTDLTIKGLSVDESALRRFREARPDLQIHSQ